MTPRSGALSLVLLGAAVSLLLSFRSRSLPFLRPAAWGCWIFVILDGIRWWGLPGMMDVVVFCLLPGVWGALVVHSPDTSKNTEKTARPRALAGVLCTAAAPLLCLLFSLALLASRHHPWIRDHWIPLLQTPRIAVFALALLVALRGRPREVNSKLVGLVMALISGSVAAWGQWGSWGTVQLFAAGSWIVVGALTLIAR